MQHKCHCQGIESKSNVLERTTRQTPHVHKVESPRSTRIPDNYLISPRHQQPSTTRGPVPFSEAEPGHWTWLFRGRIPSNLWVHRWKRVDDHNNDPKITGAQIRPWILSITNIKHSEGSDERHTRTPLAAGNKNGNINMNNKNIQTTTR